ncbi:septal ring lytic transglycosylase RlpA family protein [Pelagibius marinus]|uniref:septal ring lytic transglycosylase RlpA family protein n=1 Tax=Pelagibius marinus TaxID=2762760 RepID=UPI001D05944A|nr:septal ring lytic transglycosylase RlpA family protein [Pelagibius marinus]
MMARGLAFGVLLLGLLSVLAGCAETEFAVHNAKRLQTPEPAPSRPGDYKVGRPYQIANVWYYPREDYAYDETGIASWYGPGFHGKSTANGEVYDQNAMTAAHRTLPMPSMVQVTNLENGRSVKVRINDRGPFAHGRIIDLSKRAAELLGFMKQGTAKVRVQILEIESRQAALEAGAGEAVTGTVPQAAPVESVSVQELPPIGAASPEPAAAPTGATETAAAPTAGVSEPAPLRTASLTMPEPVVTQERVRPTSIFVQAGAFSQVANAVRLRARLSSLGNVQIAKALVGDTNFYRVRLGPMPNVDQADRTLELLLRNGYNDARVVVD